MRSVCRLASFRLDLSRLQQQQQRFLLSIHLIRSFHSIDRNSLNYHHQQRLNPRLILNPRDSSRTSMSSSASSPTRQPAAPAPTAATSPARTSAATAAAQSASLGVKDAVASHSTASRGTPGAAAASALATGALDTQNQPSQASADASAALNAAQQQSNGQKKKGENKQQGKGQGKKGGKKNSTSTNGDNANDATTEQAAAVSRRPAEWVMPQFIANRIAVWTELFDAQTAKQAKLARTPITITLPDGKTLPGQSNDTTPLDIAKQLSNSLAERCVLAKVNGVIHDLTRPFSADATLELLQFSDAEGQYTFWHSSAHVLGQALEIAFPDAHLGVGPPIADGGFYYDVQFGADGKGILSPDDFATMERCAEKVVKEKQPFERLELTPADARRMFAENKFKLEIISKIPADGLITAYRCGPLIDLCRGPHLPHTGLIKAFSVLKNSSAYWMGRADSDSLQRVYAISFPDKTRMKEWKELVKQAELRDHRKIGADQKLFFFNELSPGSAFFLPHGARIYNKLIEFIRRQYHKRGYSEVMTPNVYNLDLWKKSGHYDNYKDNMFVFEVEKAEFGMKPMNCPGHCVMFGSEMKSYRDLPLRMADFGVLHRNEISGALTGLTRVRRFQQDDAHIFARQDQIQDEVSGVLDMLQEVYSIFGFSFTLMLSTRPEKYLGDIATWDRAEEQLRACLNSFVARPNASTKVWSTNAGDGAFYGPKIDIQLTDALKRKHQCATIQLDFQLPERFKLVYKDSEGGNSRPVMIHRAILGSVERMIAVLCEHTGGQWPMWISPRQVCVIPVAELYADYGRKIALQLHNANIYADCDDSSDQFKQKIRKATLKQYNYVLIVGETEEKNGTVNVRKRKEITDAETAAEVQKNATKCAEEKEKVATEEMKTDEFLKQVLQQIADHK